MIRSSILDSEFHMDFPYATFPWRLEVNKDNHNIKGIALTVCHFECKEHMEKYLDRYNFKPKDQNRLNTVDFIERYLGYSSCTSAPGKKFKKSSTKDTIRMFYKHGASALNTEELCKELIDVLSFASLTFTGFSNIGFTKENKFNGLFATTTMVLSKVILVAKELNLVTDSKIKEILTKLDGKITPPDNQNTSTIWLFQSQWVTGFLNQLDPNDVNKINLQLADLILASRQVME